MDCHDAWLHCQKEALESPRLYAIKQGEWVRNGRCLPTATVKLGFGCKRR